MIKSAVFLYNLHMKVCFFDEMCPPPFYPSVGKLCVEISVSALYFLMGL